MALIVGMFILFVRPDLVSAIEDDTWLELRSKNFTFITNESEAAAAELLVDLETFYQFAQAVTGRAGSQEAIPQKVFYFADARTFRRFESDRYILGRFIPSRFAYSMVVAPGDIRNSAQHTIHHELVHLLTASSTSVGHPRWYQEGIAEYLGYTDVEKGAIRIRRPPSMERVANRGPAPRYALSLERLMTNPVWPRLSGDYYQLSWSFVHFLQSGHYTRGVDRSLDLNEFLIRLDDGEAVADAFQESFGMNYAALERALYQYLRRSRLPEVTFTVPEDAINTEHDVRILQQADALTELGELALRYGSEEGLLAEELLRKALAANPGSLRTKCLLGMAYRLLKRSDEAQQLIAFTVPETADAFEMAYCGAHTALLATDALEDEDFAEWARLGDHAEVLLSESLNLRPSTAPAVYYLARLYYERDADSSSSLQLMQAAAAWYPIDPDVQLMLGNLYRGSGEAALAERHLLRVLQLVHGESGLTESARNLLGEMGVEIDDSK